MENQNEQVKALFIIVNAGFADEVVEIARSCGSRGATIMSARGTGKNLEEFLGIQIEPEKEMVLTLVPENVATRIMDEVKKTEGLNTAAAGICFYMPVGNITLMNKED